MRRGTYCEGGARGGIWLGLWGGSLVGEYRSWDVAALDGGGPGWSDG